MCVLADLREDKKFPMNYPGACTVSTEQVCFPYYSSSNCVKNQAFYNLKMINSF